MRIRQATPHDASDLARIMDCVYVGEGWADPARTPAYVAQLLDAGTRIERAHVFVAELKRTPVGTATAAVHGSEYANIAQPGELEVRMLAVLQPARGHGAATRLMAACEALGRELGLSRIVLSTDEGMLAARSLYAALGYRRAPERDWAWEQTRLLVFTRDVAHR